MVFSTILHRDCVGGKGGKVGGKGGHIEKYYKCGIILLNKYMSRTYNPSKVKRAKKHGFLARKKSSSGKKVILRRMRKGRKALTVSDKTYKKRS